MNRGEEMKRKLCAFFAIGIAAMMLATPLVQAQQADVNLFVLPRKTHVGETKYIITDWEHDYNFAYAEVHISILQDICILVVILISIVMLQHFNYPVFRHKHHILSRRHYILNLVE